MYYLLVHLLALSPLAASLSIPHIPRDASPSPGTARFDAIHARGHKGLRPRGSDETSELAYAMNGWYECSVGIGDQVFTLQFDSGSADLWVNGPTTESEIGSDHTFYIPGPSATLLPDVTWSETYGGGYGASGVVYYDTVTFGNIYLENQPVEVANISTMVSPVDGILAVSLGSNTITPPGYPTFLESVYDYLAQPVFTAKLTRPEEDVGFYTFGYIDSDTVGEQTIQWTPVLSTDAGYWAFASTIADIGGNVLSLPGNVAIADTGTTLIRINDYVVGEIYGLLGGTCETSMSDTPCIYPENATVPSITLYVGNYGVTLGPDDLNFGPVDAYPGYIVGSVQPRFEVADVDIFGDVWLNNVYAIFDFTAGNPQFGFVPRAPGT